MEAHERLFGGTPPCITLSTDGVFECEGMEAGVNDQQIEAIFTAWQAVGDPQLAVRFLDATLLRVHSTPIRHVTLEALLHFAQAVTNFVAFGLTASASMKPTTAEEK